MTGKDEILSILRNLALDRAAVQLMQEDIVRIEEDVKQKELPAGKRKALEQERVRLVACLLTTASHITRIERLLGLLSAEEQKVLESFDTVLVCELNSGQFARYLRGLFPKANIVSFGKVQGQPFLVNELVDAINREI